MYESLKTTILEDNKLRIALKFKKKSIQAKKLEKIVQALSIVFVSKSTRSPINGQE